MKLEITEFRSRLREKGYKMTLQRLAIFEALHEGPLHPTAEDIHARVSEKYPIIGLSTVYNTLETLCELGQVAKVTLEPNITRYDILSSQHLHLVCLKCGEIQDVEHLTCEPCRRSVQDDFGFNIVRHTASFYGYCSKCSSEEQD